MKESSQWIIFDIGGVIVEVDFRHFITKLAGLIGHSEETIRRLLMHTPSDIP